MIDRDKNNLVKLYLEAAASPDTKPVTKPGTKPGIKPKPNHPGRPSPGPKPAPKPKAWFEDEERIIKTNEVKEFLKNRAFKFKRKSDTGRYMEAFNPGNKPNVVNPMTLRDIEEGNFQIADLIEDLDEDEQTYLEMITSKRYIELVNKLESVIGHPLTNQNKPAVFAGTTTVVQQIMTIESRNRENLERLALHVCIGLDEDGQPLVKENKIIGDLVRAGKVIIDAKLIKPDGSGFQQESEEDPIGNLSEEEKQNLSLFEQLTEDEDGPRGEQSGLQTAFDTAVLKRRFANALQAGGSSYKSHLFPLISEELNEIDPTLMSKYALGMALLDFGFWMMPPLDNIPAGMLMGKEEVNFGDEGEGGEEGEGSGDRVDTITARAIIFPVLVHEIMKGILEYMGTSNYKEMYPNIDDAEVAGEFHNAVLRKTDTVPLEREDFIVGPQMWKLITKHIPVGDQDMVHLVYKKIILQDLNTIKEVLRDGPRAARIIQGLTRQSREEMDAYENPSYQDDNSDGSNEGGGDDESWGVVPQGW